VVESLTGGSYRTVPTLGLPCRWSASQPSFGAVGAVPAHRLGAVLLVAGSGALPKVAVEEALVRDRAFKTVWVASRGDRSLLSPDEALTGTGRSPHSCIGGNGTTVRAWDGQDLTNHGPHSHRILRTLHVRTDRRPTCRFVSSDVVPCPRVSSCRKQDVSKGRLARSWHRRLTR
jgi:hypothetical protein